MSDQSDAIDQIAAALAKAQGLMEHAEKGRKNSHLGNRYSTLADVLDACRPHLAANGIAIVQTPSIGDGAVSVRTALVHASGQWLSATLSAPIGDGKGVTRAQAIGSVITYLRRYGLAALASVASDDDDGEGARPQQRPPERRPEPATPSEAVRGDAAPAASAPRWTDDERAEFAEALAKITAPEVTAVHVDDFAQSLGRPAPEGMTREQRAKFLAYLATPDGSAKITAFAKEHP